MVRATSPQSRCLRVETASVTLGGCLGPKAKELFSGRVATPVSEWYDRINSARYSEIGRIAACPTNAVGFSATGAKG